MKEKLKNLWENKKPLVIGIAIAVVSIPLAVVYFMKKRKQSAPTSKTVSTVKPK